MNKKREELYNELVGLLCKMGHPMEFGHIIATSLGTELTMTRMIRYLHVAQPDSPEEIADEMIAIIEERDKWQEKIINEKANQRYNQFRYERRFEEED